MQNSKSEPILKKIVVTGISSSLMKCLVSLIDLTEFEIIGITRSPELINLESVRIIKGDLLELDEIAHHFEECYMVIHAAAVTHSFKEKPYYDINLEATQKLIAISKEKGVDKFVYISSNTAGLENGTYGLTKHLAEVFIKKNFENAIIFKLAEVYGSNKKEGIEELIEKVLHKPLVFCPKDVPFKFYPIYIKDAVDLIYKSAFGSGSNQYPFEMVINGLNGFSYLEIIDIIKSISKRNVKIVSIKRKWMFFLKRITQVFPFYLGIIPDQIDRLYGTKAHQNPEFLNLMKFEDYIHQKIKEQNS